MHDIKAFVVFLIIVLTIYILTNLYIYSRGYLALSPAGWVFWAYTAIFILLGCLFPLGFLLRNTPYCTVCEVVTWAGSFWLGAMLYFFLFAIAFDLLFLANNYLHFVAFDIREQAVNFGKIVFLSAVALVSIVMVFGYCNSRNIKPKEVEMFLPRLPAEHDALSIALVSDIHLGIIIHEERLEEVVDGVNTLEPDIILIGGDVFDESERIVDNMVGTLSRLRSRYGVFAVLGNHDFYAGHKALVGIMERANITVLRNRLVTVPGVINIVGLDDPEGARFGEPWGGSIEDLVSEKDDALPTLLVYHPPIRMDEFAAAGIDVMVSGHSHNGQIFPFCYITNLVYAIGYGYGRVGSMQVYVSSGVGTWGPPMRVGTHSEIVKITLHSGLPQ